MIKRDITQLAVYRVEEEQETLPLVRFRSLYLEKTSEIIYVTKGKKLYGIVCLGDVLRYSQNGEVRINRTYVTLTGYNLIKAHEIFQRKPNIHKIPVIDDNGELLGDYSRWNDMLYVERNQAWFMKEEIVKKVLKPYEAVYVIQPVENRNSTYIRLLKYMKDFQIEYAILSKEQIGEKLMENSICIFLNEEERRGMQCLYGIKLLMVDNYGKNIHKYDVLADAQLRIRLATYKSLLLQIMEIEQLERLKIEKSVNLTYHEVDDKATVILSELKRKGIKCLGICNDENELTEYGKKFGDEVRERLKKYSPNYKEPWPKRYDNEEFYDELYQLEDYRKEIAQKEFYQGTHTFEYKKNQSGQYFNARNGRRVTCFQPEKYTGTIYLLGPSTVIGVFVEDRYTIASCLQEKLLEKGYGYRVVNCGAMLRYDAAIESKLEEIGEFHTNDIVIYLSMLGKLIGIEGMSLEKIFETHQIPSEWVTDAYGHCNHKATQLIADSMLEMLTPCLQNEMVKGNENERIQFNVHDVIEKYIQRKYLDQYFSHFSGEKYGTVGAIVMNCNPFDKGHRYLIEQARQRVGFLIIFVVEADEFLFPFEERINLIEEGTRDISNVLVVPSGDFIFSRNNFREYYTKRKDEFAVLDAEYDINVFADYIAKPLHITHRFTGESSKKKIMRIYKETMKRILPQKGIAYVEIPRMKIENEVVSTSKVREYLRSENYSKAFGLLPETTERYLMGQLDMTEVDSK